MKRLLLRPLFVLSVLALFTANLCAQGDYVYTNNNVGGPNTVSAWAVAADGSVTAVAGSPFATGGTGEGGGYYASGRAQICAVDNFLYVSNGGSNTVSGFSIDPMTGVLTPVPGSPFATGGASGGLGIPLAVSVDNSFLYAAHGGSSNIRVFGINFDGSLTAIGGLVPAGGVGPDGIKTVPGCDFLLVALPNNGPDGAVAMFDIAADGTITPVPGSPFLVPGVGGSVATNVDVDCAGTTAAVGEATFGSTTVALMFIDHTAKTLTPIALLNPPLGQNSNVALFGVGDAYLYVTNQFSNTVTVIKLDDLSALSFTAGGFDQQPAGEATNQAGTHLYTGKFTNFLTVFNIAADGSLTVAPGSPINTGQPPGLLDVAAFPPKSCP